LAKLGIMEVLGSTVVGVAMTRDSLLGGIIATIVCGVMCLGWLAAIFLLAQLMAD
jgi:hypothetical protein